MGRKTPDLSHPVFAQLEVWELVGTTSRYRLLEDSLCAHILSNTCDSNHRHNLVAVSDDGVKQECVCIHYAADNIDGVASKSASHHGRCIDYRSSADGDGSSVLASLKSKIYVKR